MADQKPPRVDSGEREVLCALLNYQRESVVRKVAGLSEQQANWSPVVSATSAHWLITHLANAERTWVIERFAGERRVDLAEQPEEITAALARYVATSEQVDQVIARSDFNDACRNEALEPPINLRWIVAHLVEETARHAGHLDIIVEMIDGRTGR